MILPHSARLCDRRFGAAERDLERRVVGCIWLAHGDPDRVAIDEQRTPVRLTIPVVDHVVGAALEHPDGEIEPVRRNRFKSKSCRCHEGLLHLY